MTQPLNDPLAEGQRVDWGVAVLVFLELAVLVPLGILYGVGELDSLPLLPPLLVFIALRLPGDIARAVAGTSPMGLAVEGPMKAIAWATVPHGLVYTFTQQTGLGALWLVGAALTLFALALWGHHARALPHAPRIARLEGTTGAVVAPFGLAAASTFLDLPAPWSVLFPAGILVVAAALAARGVHRLWRPHAHETKGGWSGWYRSHFFRLSVLLGAVVVYLFVRDTLAGVVPFLFLFEYSFAVFVAAGILWSLRGFARGMVTENVPVGPHRRHEQAVQRQGERAFDDTEGALGRFLETGDPGSVQELVRRLEKDGVQTGTAFATVIAQAPQRGVLLVHPGWLYASRLIVVALFTWALTATLPPRAFGIALLVTAAGLYAAQWNRFGGPWYLKTGLALAGLFLAFTVFVAEGAGAVLLQMPFAVVGIVAFALSLVHPFRAQKGRPVPRFLYQGQEPLDAITPLIRRYDRSILARAAWLAIIGIPVFLVVGELGRFLTGVDIIFTFYLALAFAMLTYPVLVAAGLRTGRNEARRRNERARKQREALLEDAARRLEKHWVGKEGKRTPLRG